MTTANGTQKFSGDLESLALAELQRNLPAAIELRHHVHRNPSLGGTEQATRADVLDMLQLPATEVAEGMFVRVGPDSGPAIAGRAELDGLPILEESQVPWRSEIDGVAHLCGHDVHMAALAATTLTLRAIDCPFPFVAAFQPREETMPAGAIDFIEHPEFLAQGIRAMIGVHLQPVLPQGTISVAAGAVNASADDFDIIIRGVSAHGAYPHLGRDPIVAAAGVIQAVQHLVSRRVNPMNPAVVTIGRIVGGNSHNQISEVVTLQGTIRGYTAEDREALAHTLRQLVADVAAGYGCTAEFTLLPGEPVLVNDPDLVHALHGELTQNGFHLAEPFRSCGADDFAFYSQAFPSAMIFAGVGDARPGAPGLHHAEFVPDDSAVDTVARIYLHAYFAAAGQLLHHQEGTTE